MRNEALFREVMIAPARQAGEEAPDWQAPRLPSVMPKVLLIGSALVLASAIFSAPLDRYLEQRRVAAEMEETREKGRAELERRAQDVATRLWGERQAAWDSVSGLGKAAPEGLPLSEPLNLDEQITADAADYAIRGQAKAVDAAIHAYKADTQRVLDYVAHARAEQRREAAQQAIAAVQAPPVADRAQPQQAARASSMAPPPVFVPPPPPVAAPRPAPVQAEKRQVTNW